MNVNNHALLLFTAMLRIHIAPSTIALILGMDRRFKSNRDFAAQVLRCHRALFPNERRGLCLK